MEPHALPHARHFKDCCTLSRLSTGTPLQNDLMELWSLLHFLMPDTSKIAALCPACSQAHPCRMTSWSCGVSCTSSCPTSLPATLSSGIGSAAHSLAWWRAQSRSTRCMLVCVRVCVCVCLCLPMHMVDGAESFNKVHACVYVCVFVRMPLHIPTPHCICMLAVLTCSFWQSTKILMGVSQVFTAVTRACWLPWNMLNKHLAHTHTYK